MVGSELLDIMSEAAGGLLGSGHSWVGAVEAGAPTISTPMAPPQPASSSSRPAEIAADRPAKDAAEIEADIVALVQDFVGPNVSADQPLAAQGLDSLAAMELRQKLQVCKCIICAVLHGYTRPLILLDLCEQVFLIDSCGNFKHTSVELDCDNFGQGKAKQAPRLSMVFQSMAVGLWQCTEDQEP